MKFIADLHLHSHFSIATSKDLDPEHVAKWAQLKGVQVVGTGDIAHPGWLEELRAKLEPAEEGLFRLKEEYARTVRQEVPAACRRPVRFLLGGEISNIYKKYDQTRKNHNVVFAPGFEAVEWLQASLDNIGNIRSDGRPILGLDARDLLEIVLETDPQAYLIPAHIWTPWFSLFGSKSGFDSDEECFEDLTSHLFAVETGLSSDPPMNWRLSALDKYTLVSNSDAHSPRKLAREANIFDTELSYEGIFRAIHSGNPETFLGTIEFYPQEGKYHYDGHRKCGIRWDPGTTLQHEGTCPECGKPVTVGVMHRVESLADREPGVKPEHAPPFHSLIPLPEILSEIHDVGANTKTVRREYHLLLENLGSELDILLDIPLEDIEKAGGVVLAEGIRRMRDDEIIVQEGFDGEYGIIKVFEEGETESLTAQMSFFNAEETQDQAKAAVSDSELSDQYEPDDVLVFPRDGMLGETSDTSTEAEQAGLFTEEELRSKSSIQAGLNDEQREAVQCVDRHVIIVAGPGTGKTRTLTHRIAHLIAEQEMAPDQVLAITFTNKAAGEMEQRLGRLLGKTATGQITIKTFHALGATILREHGDHLDIPPRFTICGETDRAALLKETGYIKSRADEGKYIDAISHAKSQLLDPESPEFRQILPGDDSWPEVYQAYQMLLRRNQMVDFEDLLRLPIQLFRNHPEVLDAYQLQYQWISVDEYQDINYAQYQLLQLLTAPETNLCVIGDPDQAIYGFRGADRSFFLRFTEDFPDSRTIYLTRNYRSTGMILNASTQVIARGSESKPLDMWTDVVSNTRLEIFKAATYKAEAEYVVHQIEKMVGGTGFFSLDSGRVASEEDGERSFSDFAVLYRVNAQSHALREAFERSGMPYQTVGEQSLYDRKEVREVLSYLWYLHNPDSLYHLRQIVETEHSKVSLEQIRRIFAPAGGDLSEVGETLTDTEIENTVLIRQVEESLPLLRELRQAPDATPVNELIGRIWKALLEQDSSRYTERRNEHIMKLVARAAPYDDRLGDFLEEIALQRETDLYDPRADRVTLLTLHAAKGLEFPVVFIVGCEEHLIPYQREGRQYDEQEERRLFYVGMTRAQEKLVLTHARKRFLFGETMQNAPSRFLNDIEETLTEMKEAERRKPVKEKESGQMDMF